MIQTSSLHIKTRGNGHIIDLTGQVEEFLHSSKVAEAAIALFVVGSTAGLTAIEYEPGLVNHDMEAAFEKLAPQDGQYRHEETWHDDNGHAHVRASLLGPSLHVPVVGGKMALGTWQQIVLIDFDTRPRDREVICQLLS
jgi:secondary thiamine-phosphate synthase enzyme